MWRDIINFCWHILQLFIHNPLNTYSPRKSASSSSTSDWVPPILSGRGELPRSTAPLPIPSLSPLIALLTSPS
jgi:hypothetical protein